MSYHCSLTAIREPSGESAGSVPTWLLARIAEEKDLRFAPHPFKSLAQMCLVLRVKLPQAKHCYWRLCDYELGYVDGLPNSYGRSLATNGLHVLVLHPDTGKTGLYHKEWFKPVDVLEESDGSRKPRREKENRVAKMFDKLYEQM